MTEQTDLPDFDNPDPPATARYADAMIHALHDTAIADGGEPDINAALAALTFCQAYLLAKLPDWQRADAVATCRDELVTETRRQVAENHLAQAEPVRSA